MENTILTTTAHKRAGREGTKMGRRFSFSLIITRRTLVLCTAIVLCGAAVLFGPPCSTRSVSVLSEAWGDLRRFSRGGLLEHELAMLSQACRKTITLRLATLLGTGRLMQFSRAGWAGRM